MRKKLSIVFVIFGLFVLSCQNSNYIIGELDNGLKYYIHKTNNPKDKVLMNLAVRAGSVDETEEQRGLAHLLEHMAFNGSKNFPEETLIDFLQSLGIQYGPELNAYTSFNQTVYKLEIPLNNPENLETGFKVLEDWAFNLDLKDESIEKERLVVIEEYRVRRNASYRIAMQYWPLLFNQTKYAERMPIGTLESLETFTPDMVREFYKTHYTPDRMGIIIAGELNPKAIEKKIIKQFGAYTTETSIKPFVGDMPQSTSEKFLTIQENELPYTLVQILSNNDFIKDTLENKIRESIFLTALNSRFLAVKEKGNTEILEVAAWNSPIIASAKTFSLSYICNENAITQSLFDVFKEIKSLEEFGFSENEVQTAGKLVLENLKTLYINEGNISAGSWIEVYKDIFVYDKEFFTNKTNYQTASKILESLTKEDINKYIGKFFQRDNMLCLVSTPIIPPEIEELETAVEKAYQSEVGNQEFGDYIEELECEILEKGKILSEDFDKDLGIRVFTLSNNAKVILKQNKEEKGQIAFSQISRGGYSTAYDADLINAKALSRIIAGSGVGPYNAIQIATWKKTNNIALKFSINEQHEMFTGKFPANKAEDFFKLLNLQMTVPNTSKENFAQIVKSIETDAKNRLNDLNEILGDQILNYLSQDNPRFIDLSYEEAKAIEQDRVFEIFKEKTSKQGDDVYIFVGDISAKQLRPFLKKYIATIGSSEESSFNNNRMPYPETGESFTLKMGQENIATTRIYYTGQSEITDHNVQAITMLSYIMDTILNKKIREELGGTYSISTVGTTRIYPYNELVFVVGFSCDPSRLEDLLSAIYQELDNVAQGNIPEEYIENYYKTIEVARSSSTKTNNFWLKSLTELYKDETTIEQILHQEKIVKNIKASDIQEIAEKIFSSARGEFIHLPE